MNLNTVINVIILGGQTFFYLELKCTNGSTCKLPFCYLRICYKFFKFCLSLRLHGMKEVALTLA